MKASLVVLFLALATAVHAAVTGNLKFRARRDNEAERAAGMADAVTDEYKKTYGVTPELEAMIRADSSGGQGVNNYYESFVPVNPIGEGTKKQVETNNDYGPVIPVYPQPPSHSVVTVISSIVTTRTTTVTASFTVTKTTTSTATSTVSICTSKEYPPWVPSYIHPIGTGSVISVPPNPPVTITVALTTRTSLPVGTATISYTPSSHTAGTVTVCPTLSRSHVVIITRTLSVHPTGGPVGTATITPIPSEHPIQTITIITSYTQSPIGTMTIITITTRHPVPTEYPIGTATIIPLPNSTHTLITQSYSITPIGTTTAVTITSKHPATSEHPVETATVHPSPSFVTATIITGGTSEGPVGTATITPVPTEHPSDVPIGTTTMHPIPPTLTTSYVTFVGPYPTSTVNRGAGTATIYPITSHVPSMRNSSMINPTTLVTSVRDPIAIIG